MHFEVWYLKNLDDEFEDPEVVFIEAPSWLMALQIAEAGIPKHKKYLASLARLE
jgi:hypothetical protein